MSREAATRLILESACAAVGYSAARAEVISMNENAVYRLPGGVVARISRPGQLETARREVVVSRWLEDSGIRAVRVIRELPQPIEVEGQPVVFWHELPPHEISRPAQVGRMLRQLHDLPAPTDIGLGRVQPFVRLDQRIEAAPSLTDDDRVWMHEHLASLEQRWANLPNGLPWCAIHGDAHEGNIVTADDGRAILLDLERFCIGPPEWDTVQTAVNWASCGWISEGEYKEFVTAYGHDIMEWDGFELLRDVREFRMTSWLAQLAAENASLHEQAAYRVACLRGKEGERPWSGWKAKY
ncbi:aminoglycoside phosphotransferase family protein [Nocardia pseudovaccinii]|uniref:aminoglycoside phosphotransferase family protein n=1 Tax=Nocardia pseudovaccinii TaxID=189540 RepID=UPI0007A45C2A|nr:aminoglycoside phosphotransferase family protein [Nocardia pseudovaccinii]